MTFIGPQERHLTAREKWVEIGYTEGIIKGYSVYRSRSRINWITEALGYKNDPASYDRQTI